MKQIALIVLAFLCVNAIHAQRGSGVEFGFGVDAGVPVGNDLKKFTNVGFGGDATLGYNFDPKYALLVRGGYMSFVVNNDYRGPKFKSIGDGFIKLCGRYTYTKRLYIEPQIGYTRFSSGTKRSVNAGNGFTYAAQAGLFLDKLKTFDVSLRYEGTATDNGIDFVGLRLAYSLKSGMYF